MLWRRIHYFFMLHKIKFIIASVIVLLVGFSIWGLSSLESFYRNITLAQLPVSLLVGGLHAMIFVFMYMFVLRGGFAKMQKNSIKSQLVDIKWDDVIGMDEAKREAMELVHLIKDRKNIVQMGGNILRGLLMIGPPGCGKTYLAKAIATEAGMPFISMSGSEFVEVFVGVGASRVRSLFKKARTLAYGYGACIIFIDEIDAVGRKRVFSVFGGTEETNSTQNQLLAEMDGLKEKGYDVLVIGATNAREDNIDDALLRPGRFDRKIYIDRPNLEEREKLFSYYLSKINHDPKIDFGRLARRCVYKSPADISNIVREATLIATRNRKYVVTFKEISEAIERIDLGVKHKKSMNEQERATIAYHESGHLIVMYILHPTDDVFKASIVSRKDTLGVVYHQPRDEFHTSNKERLIANIKVSLAGYAAEKLRFGTTSNGVSGDFRNAMAIAHTMVWRYGMGSNGYLGDYASIPESQISEKVKEDLNKETNKIFKDCLEDVDNLLKKQSSLLDRFAKELLQKEELEYDEIEEIFREYGISGLRDTLSQGTVPNNLSQAPKSHEEPPKNS